MRTAYQTSNLGRLIIMEEQVTNRNYNLEIIKNDKPIIISLHMLLPWTVLRDVSL